VHLNWQSFCEFVNNKHVCQANVRLMSGGELGLCVCVFVGEDVSGPSKTSKKAKPAKGGGAGQEGGDAKSKKTGTRCVGGRERQC